MEEDDKDLDALALDITTDEIEVTKEDTSGTWEHEDLAQVKIKVMRGHKDSVTGCQFCCDDTKVLTCSNDKTCILWDIESGKPVQTYEGHARFVTSCSMKHDNTKFVSSSWDKTVTMWDVETAKILWQGHHDGIVTCCKFSNNGKYVVSGSDLDYALNVWNAKDGSLIHHRTNHHKSTIASCSFSPNDERVCTTSMDKTTKIWDTISHNVTVTLRSHINVISTCCFSKDERRLCTGSWDKQLQMWDISTGMFRSEGPVTLNKGHEGSISSCQFSQDETKTV
ncbi:WD repeat-containing protein 88-like [Saccoglossus kowalevskii]